MAARTDGGAMSDETLRERLESMFRYPEGACRVCHEEAHTDNYPHHTFDCPVPDAVEIVTQLESGLAARPTWDEVREMLMDAAEDGVLRGRDGETAPDVSEIADALIREHREAERGS